MMKFDVFQQGAMRVCLSLMLAALLTACGGGGGGSGTPVVGPGSGASGPSTAASGVASRLDIVLSKDTMTNSGADSVTATVMSVDANGVAVADVPVSFSVNANAAVVPAGRGTDSTGKLTATVTQGQDTSVRPVTVTAASGTVTRSVTFNVVQSPASTNPQASRLSLQLSAPNIDNSGSKTVTAIATAVDDKGNVLAGIPLQLSVSENSAYISGAASQTNANGQVTGTVNIGQDRTNRTVTVTATSGTLVRTAAFEITGTQFTQASPVPSVVTAGAAGTVQYTLSDVNGNPMSGVPISVSGSGITTRSGTTNLNGGYTFAYTAPATPGTSLTINAAAGGATSAVTVTVPGGSTTVPDAAPPDSATLNLSANVVSVNNDRTNNQVAVSAFFRSNANAPVPNVRVLFGVTGDNQTGAIGSGKNTVLSDASGMASTTYSPGAVSSPTNGVTIYACFKTQDFAADAVATNCAAAGGVLRTTTLTIVSNPVSISIGTDNSISIGASGLTYVKKFAVLVVDSAGNPKPDVQITPSVEFGGYGKGNWGWNAVTQHWERSPGNGTAGLLTATCANEDLNRNGVIDTGEDLNGNQQLDPRKSDASITLVGATKTDASGVAVLQLEYPQSVASWVKYKITVTAAGVLSPPAYYPLGVPVALPSLASPADINDYLYTYVWLPVLADVLNAESPPPAFAVSPYGVASSCANPR